MALIFIKDQQVKELGQEWNEENLLAWFYKVFASPPSISPKENGVQRERRSSGGRPQLYALSDMKRMKKITPIVYCQTESKHEKETPHKVTL